MKIITLFFFIISLNLKAQSLDERLLIQLAEIEVKTSAPQYTRQAISLLNQDGRGVAFKLQAYGRLFENEFTPLLDLKNSFKELEDQIGQCKKWNDLLKETTTPAKKEKYQTHLDQEILKLAGLLKVWRDKGNIAGFKSIAADITLDQNETLKLAHKNFRKETKKLISKQFDFKYGETGLHELRRNIRWPKIYLELFSNQIVLQKNHCKESKNDLLQIGMAKNKVTFTGATSSNAITIDECAFLKLVGAVELLGNVKDELEKKEILEDILPKKIKEQTISIYEELVEEILPLFLTKS